MIPHSKISQTLLEFGEDILDELPNNYSKKELNSAVIILICAWNAVTIDAWEGKNNNETLLLQTLVSQPEQVQMKIKKLIARKKRDYSNDLRAIGDHWIKEQNGELVFGCEARGK